MFGRNAILSSWRVVVAVTALTLSGCTPGSTAVPAGPETGPTAAPTVAAAVAATSAPAPPEPTAQPARRESAPGVPPVAAAAATVTTEPPRASTPTVTPAASGVVVRQEVANTGGQGANLRAAPGTSAAPVKLLPDGASVLVIGPVRVSDGHAWLNVQDDAGAAGWMAADFLAEPDMTARVPATGAAPDGPVPGGVIEQPRGGAPDVPAATIEDSQGRPMARYFVPTITCPSCAARIKANAKKDPGVVEVAVDLATQRVTVAYDPEKTDPERIAEAIRAGGDTVLSGE